MVCFLRRKAFSIMSRSPTFSSWIDTKASGALTSEQRDIWAQGKWVHNKKSSLQLSGGQEHLKPCTGHCGKRAGGSVSIVLICLECFWLYSWGCWCVTILLGDPHVPKACTSSSKLHSLTQCFILSRSFYAFLAWSVGVPGLKCPPKGPLN